jgi:hypothetical protein
MSKRLVLLIATTLTTSASLGILDSAIHAASGNSISIPDDAGVRGYISLAVDESGFPVMSYAYGTIGLKILRCNDPNCAPGGDSTNTPDPALGGPYTSIALDSSAHPVVSYLDAGIGLKILRCDDPNCAPGGESISTPDSTTTGGQYTSLSLDSSGYPVVSYYDFAEGDLRILHCDDLGCTGDGESVNTLDDQGDVGQYTSLELDASGFPVVSYYDSSNGDLKVLHCDDPDCTGGGDIISIPDFVGDVGQYSSIELDPSGNPVVSYYKAGTEDLRVLRCNDPYCVGGDESIATPDSSFSVGSHTSLALDASGIPVVSYYLAGSSDLRLLRCDDPNCSGGGESISTPDVLGWVGQYTSLQLDSSERPVIAYHDVFLGDLKVLHCVDPSCDADLDNDGCTDGHEQQSAGGTQTSGGLRSPKIFWDFFDTPDSSNIRDKAVAGTDFFRVLARFGATGDSMIDPLSTPPLAPAYHTAFDRGPSSGPNPWNLTQADGSITGTDFFAMLAQFGHSCA